jgi:hypothetical protein
MQLSWALIFLSVLSVVGAEPKHKVKAKKHKVRTVNAPKHEVEAKPKARQLMADPRDVGKAFEKAEDRWIQEMTTDLHSFGYQKVAAADRSQHLRARVSSGSSVNHAVVATGPAPGPAPGGPAPGPGAEEMKPPDAFMGDCLHIVQAILYNSEGHHHDIGEYMTIVCSVPASNADVQLCEDFRESLLGHLHPADYKWNRNGMDLPLFCTGFYKIVHQHVYTYYPHERPSAGPGGAPGPAGSPAPVAPPPGF